MSKIQTIAIAGFNGKMARLITTCLLKSHPNIVIHGLTRNPSKVNSSLLSNPRIKIFETSSTDLASLRKALAGSSVCICCYLGPHSLMIEGQKTLIDACIAERVPRYVASDWSLDFRNLKMGELPIKDPMKAVQAYLEEKEGEIKGVHVLNGVFMEVLWAPFGGWVDAKKAVFRYYGTGEEKLDCTTYEDAARFTASVAVDEEANGFLNVLGDRKSVKEMAALYQKTYSVEAKVERMGSLDDLYAKMTKAFQENPDNRYAWMGMYYQFYMTNGQTSLGELQNERYPGVVPSGGVERFLKAHSKETVGKAFMF